MFEISSHPVLRTGGVEDVSRAFIEARLQCFLPEPTGTVRIGLSLLNPLFDEKLLQAMIAAAVRTNTRVVAAGAVPGTAPLFVAPAAEAHAAPANGPYVVYSDRQRRYNCQLNIARLKRAKLFQRFTEHFPDLANWPLEKILDFNGSAEGTAFILSYGTGVQLVREAACPLCGSAELVAQHADVGQPVTGFLTRHSVCYWLCGECHLVFLNPHMPEDELWRYYDVFAYDNVFDIASLPEHYDGVNAENTSTFYNYEAARPYMQTLPADAVALDLGGGLGEFTVYTRQRFPGFSISLYDFRVEASVQAELRERNIQSKETNFLNEDLGSEVADLITNWEVLEHLPPQKLAAFFHSVYKALRPGGLYIFSTPDFDSAYAHALDFWAAYPGEHLSVLSRRVLEPLLQRAGFQVVAEHHECVTLKAPGRWFKYGAEMDSFMASRGEAAIIDDFLQPDACRSTLHQAMRTANKGSEIILVCRKRPS